MSFSFAVQVGDLLEPGEWTSISAAFHTQMGLRRNKNLAPQPCNDGSHRVFTKNG